MKSIRSPNASHDPRFYQELGQLVSSTGSSTFAGQMLQLVDTLVSVQGIVLCEWALDAASNVERITRLGGAGVQHDICASDVLQQSLLQSIVHMDASLLVQTRVPVGQKSARRDIQVCSLVSSSGELRRIICFYRLAGSKAFSLSELSLLKSLSDTLLPLVEHHSQLLVQSAAEKIESEPGSIDEAFSGRLAQDAITLSAREQEVCIGLLTGGSVAEMARRLNVKNSSVETYLKRATAKLGVSGRHSLARWMAGP
ncbi:helix-turn-helix transcriptional regulator [Pseudomonas viridiflava]|jgi:Response regulator containing a CheY-like receiver domain and an HTH DNA-binding domain|uniref:helix-turn-helix transcriptional regulator n=1 Tax=Pseudomonas viridiflava TaxID=33069 RepID=UPI000F024A81|nr:helix-turn-helix transcriptional regulator [Pseudomonas viridiflava]MEE3914398.1 helix-turn-helix transcriptional regulator [Pseudomonas viridiflava]MEE3973301.1 helix-turn-helix transcriptional regulator [Pseudomonas viridiflava]MEE4018153.1 helix-turn-helix transcriptional regulator [Pseudomonas viridiflava]MEE4044402.1 helix-turn-helix transcriptional regulator [Pseudomonas viridiflava]MEE4103471.1 helix-turn-helix transcriptional regulator [Pseudomonas viridiflava]